MAPLRTAVFSPGFLAPPDSLHYRGPTPRFHKRLLPAPYHAPEQPRRLYYNLIAIILYNHHNHQGVSGCGERKAPGALRRGFWELFEFLREKPLGGAAPKSPATCRGLSLHQRPLPILGVSCCSLWATERSGVVLVRDAAPSLPRHGFSSAGTTVIWISTNPSLSLKMSSSMRK
jgi:hypothetical protein